MPKIRGIPSSRSRVLICTRRTARTASSLKDSPHVRVRAFQPAASRKCSSWVAKRTDCASELSWGETERRAFPRMSMVVIVCRSRRQGSRCVLRKRRLVRRSGCGVLVGGPGNQALLEVWPWVLTTSVTGSVALFLGSVVVVRPSTRGRPTCFSPLE